jgi:hypothetical protein
MYEEGRTPNPFSCEMAHPAREEFYKLCLNRGHTEEVHEIRHFAMHSNNKLLM